MSVLDPARTVTDLRQTVRDLTAEWLAAGRYVPRSDCWLRSFDLEFSRELAARGLIGLTWPTEFGGAGLDARSRLAVTEELLRAGAPVAAHWIGDRQIGPTILRYGTPELQHELLPGIVAAEYLFCLGMSEPEAGSDLAAVHTTAVKVDGGWRVNGRKTWTSQAHHATHAYLLARTDASGRKHEGLSEFVVDMASDGVEVSPIWDMSGEHHFNEVSFTDVFVPDGWLIGEVGNGWRQVTEQLSFERGGPERVLSTYPLLREVMQELREAGEGRFDAELGELVARLSVLRRQCWEIAEALDAGRAPITEAASLKYLGTEFEVDVIEFARRAGFGVAHNDSLAQALCAAPGFSIRGGSSDVLLSIIAKSEVRSQTAP
ncbi:alkylation response protein AidB-like acyl-CoA dehydrogenase [Mycolicibacterium sp. BK634]|uniref:acyl-CoA dehydrogenase family protein n=1 Tax=Mycobacteriaceae TaxID=1762 RepID=UPI00105F4B97|nr:MULTISPECIES: acyl-CoA dehydrogenase family protein [Mycobacteriaceae]MBB3748397.1 alkylation response protein AidB-like acyl-CoA dehydrogenase [Mycolicibacterium sp. BK634]TDO10185.1 alkylation response protein AidB-like acyl-CoA dehydrogenase [Mycobacterium sp. BK086]